MYKYVCTNVYIFDNTQRHLLDSTHVYGQHLMWYFSTLLVLHPTVDVHVSCMEGVSACGAGGYIVTCTLEVNPAMHADRYQGVFLYI